MALALLKCAQSVVSLENDLVVGLVALLGHREASAGNVPHAMARETLCCCRSLSKSNALSWFESSDFGEVYSRLFVTHKFLFALLDLAIDCTHQLYNMPDSSTVLICTKMSLQYRM